MGRLPCDPLACECFGSCKGDYSPHARTDLLTLINERLSMMNGRGIAQEKRVALLIDALGLIAEFSPMPAAARPLIKRLVDGLKSA
jgi:hypothetical protein